MRIIFVRHGDPDYVHDCLTETGHVQAAAAAQRLKTEPISEIYASPNGRAQLTAEYTARELGLPIHTLDYMHEIDWGGKNEPIALCGHPWKLSEKMLQLENYCFSPENWREHPYFKDNICLDFCDRLATEFDGLLAEKGFKREGYRYLCTEENEKTIAVFSHGGSGACVLAHLLNLPFPYLCSVMPYDFTSVSILNMRSRKGEYTFPQIELFNDAAHIRRNADGPAFGK